MSSIMRYMSDADFNSPTYEFVMHITSVLIPQQLIRTNKSAVLELWGIVTAEEVPIWRTPFDNSMEELEERQKQRIKMDRLMQEGKLRGADWTKATQERFQMERREQQFANERKKVEEEKKAAQEMVEALGSVRLSMKVVAAACQKYLVSQKRVDASLTVPQIVERVLWEMAVKDDASKALAGCLDIWKKWASQGGMALSEYNAMQENLTVFAYAACIVNVISDAAETLEGNNSSDMSECLRLYKR
jgi:hypothetical protein